MPKAILAIRSYPATLLLALFLFLATLIVTTGSLGKVGTGSNGGDGGDGGSGIGGTGRSGEFGGSGFGGTGGPAPFFTSVDEDEQVAPEPAVLTPSEVLADEAVIEIATSEPAAATDSPVEQTLETAIEEAVEQHPLVQESDVMLAAEENGVDAAVQSAEPVSVQQLQIVEATQSARDDASGQESQIGIEQAVEAETEAVFSTVAEHAVDAEPSAESEVMQHVAETMPVKLETTPDAQEPEIDRRALPERIQRPELPPFQRIRPVERAAIMPPRIQPMRI